MHTRQRSSFRSARWRLPFRRARTLIGLIALLVAAAGVTGCGQPEIAALTGDLDEAEVFELLVLDPQESSAARNTFHGWEVVGRRSIPDAETRGILVRTADRMPSTEGAFACFSPRHALHIVQGESVIDLVICFECREVKAYVNGEHTLTRPVSDSGDHIYTEILRRSSAAEKAVR